tara:strand:+ start:723 stop:962 length:240 start_codon:yes stop_codon:yes gene_type:complete
MTVNNTSLYAPIAEQKNRCILITISISDVFNVAQWSVWIENSPSLYPKVTWLRFTTWLYRVFVMSAPEKPLFVQPVFYP